MSTRKLPANMSQLDYLWTNFGNFEVGADGIISAPILQEYLKEYTKGGIVDIKLLPKSENTLELVLYGQDGGIINTIEVSKEDHLEKVESILSTYEEIENKVCTELNIPLIVFTMKSGKKHYIQQTNYTGVETNSIITSVANNKIAAQLKIDRSLEVPVVNVDITESGLKIDLNINPDKDKQLRLVKTKNGLDTTYTWDSGDNILFDIVSFAQYSLLKNPVKGKIYFIPDENCIYLNGVKYDGKSTNTGETIENTDKGLEVRIDPDEDNLLEKTNAGLSAKLYWDE